MTAWDDALKTLDLSRRNLIREKLFLNLEKFTFEPFQIELSDLDSDWINRCTAVGPGGEIIRNLIVTVRTPSALNLNWRYDWPMISVSPVEIDYYNEGHEFNFIYKPDYRYDDKSGSQ